MLRTIAQRGRETPVPEVPVVPVPEAEAIELQVPVEHEIASMEAEEVPEVSESTPKCEVPAVNLSAWTCEKAESCEADSPTTEEPPARPKHYMEEEWYINLPAREKVAVQKARWQKHLEEQEAKRKAEAEPVETETEVPVSQPTAVDIDAWLDEQCDAADMFDEEVDAMVDEAMKAEIEPYAPAENPEAPKSGGTVIYVPRHDDGLDDDDEDLRLYGGLYSN